MTSQRGSTLWPGFRCPRLCVCHCYCPRYFRRQKTEDGHHESFLADYGIILRTDCTVVVLAVRPSRADKSPDGRKLFWQTTFVGDSHCGAGCTEGDFAGGDRGSNSTAPLW